MARGKKTGGRCFPIGHQINKGREHHPEAARIRRLTHKDVFDMGSLILNGSASELVAISKDPQSSALKAWISAVVINGINTGDANALNALLDRLIGKVKERIELTGDNGGPLRSEVVLAQLAPEQLVQLEKILEKANGPADDSIYVEASPGGAGQTQPI